MVVLVFVQLQRLLHVPRSQAPPLGVQRRTHRLRARRRERREGDPGVLYQLVDHGQQQSVLGSGRLCGRKVRDK